MVRSASREDGLPCGVRGSKRLGEWVRWLIGGEWKHSPPHSPTSLPIPHSLPSLHHICPSFHHNPTNPPIPATNCHPFPPFLATIAILPLPWVWHILSLIEPSPFPPSYGQWSARGTFHTAPACHGLAGRWLAGLGTPRIHTQESNYPSAARKGRNGVSLSSPWTDCSLLVKIALENTFFTVTRKGIVLH